MKSFLRVAGLLVLLGTAFSAPAQHDGTSAIIWLYRPKVGVNDECRAQVTVGTEPTIGLVSGEVVKLMITSRGTLEVTALMDKCGVKKSGKLSVSVAPGKELFVQVSPSGPFLTEQKESWAARFMTKESGRVLTVSASPTASAKADELPPTSASGLLVSEQGLILTNDRAVANADTVRVWGVNGDFGTPQLARVVAEDRSNDLALVRLLTPPALDSVPYRLRSTPLLEGAMVWGLAYRGNLAPTMQPSRAPGIIRANPLGAAGDATQLLVTSKASDPAEVPPSHLPAASPLFDEQGNLIGMLDTRRRLLGDTASVLRGSYVRALFNVTNLNDATICGPHHASPAQPKADGSRLARFIYRIELK